jgi:hypothetical protein
MSTKAASDVPVALEEILNRIGGNVETVRRWVESVGGSIGATWDGRPCVSAATAAEIVQRADEQNTETRRSPPGM